ncbi:MAG: tetratricopeptide repeat protein [Fimbriiglobus sp.]|nr:tetratricopeptide repeat protein [Fimbriiglobus sp.]
MPAPSADELFAAAVQIHTSGDLAAAESAYRDLLRAVPTHAPALCNLGAIRAKIGDESEAIRLYQLALAAQPNFPDALYNLGNIHRRAGRLEQAGDLFLACTKAAPDHAPAQFNLGVVAAQFGDFARAEAAFRRVTEVEGSVGRAHLRLGEVLHRLGRPGEAVPPLRAYSEAFPDDPTGPFQLALALAADGKAADAIGLLQAALKRTPNDPDAHNALGLAQASLGRQDDAVHHFERAVSLKPEMAEGWSNLAVCLAEQGRTDEAVDAFRQALAVREEAPLIHSNLLLNLNYSSRLTPEQVRDEHFAWGDRYADPAPAAPRPPLDPARRLRVGYLSGFFRDHPQVGLLRAVLEHHDRDLVEVFVYATVHRPDATTDALRPLADHWHTAAGTTPTMLAEQIRSDGIDILIDVGGHSQGVNLLTFARRPATVQASLGGYPNTTGLPTMGYRLTDAISDPPGATDHLYRERLIRLPDVPWVYRPPTIAPAVNPLPALARRPFTFGCLNNSSKVSAACLDLWVSLLQKTPGSRLVLLGGQSGAGQRRLAERFVKAGILRDRVQLVPRMPRDKYLTQYTDIDIGLDPFPTNGGVTTADALWMGVPVLTVAGKTAAGRQGVMLMLAVGLGEFVVSEPDELPATAKGWMNRRAELATIRAELRERVADSPLCDHRRFVRHLEAAYRQMWAEAISG